MKTILSKSYITVYFLLVSFLTFANPGEDDDAGGLDGGDSAQGLPATPIDDYIIPIAIFSILCTFMYFRSLKAKQIQKQNRRH